MADLENVSAQAPSDDVAAPATQVVAETPDAGLSDDAIIEKYSKKTEAKAEAKPKTTDVVEAKADEAKTEVTEEDETPSAEDLEHPLPEAWKETIKGLRQTNPEVAKQIKDEHYALAAYKSAFPQISDAREFRGMFSSVDEAKTVKADAETLLNAQMTYSQDPAKFAAVLQEADPGAFYQLANRVNTHLYSVDPEAYRAMIEKPILEGFHGVFKRWAMENQDEELQTALEIVQERMGGNRQERPNPRDPQYRRLQELEQREARRRDQDAQNARYAERNLVENAGAAVQGVVEKSVAEMIERSGATGLSSEAKKEVSSRVLDEVEQHLKSDAYLQRRIQFVQRSGGDPTQKRDAIANLLHAKAETVLASKLSERLRWMTKDILGMQKTNGQVATKPDIGSGGQGGRTSGKKYSQADYNKMTEDEVIEATRSR